MLGSPEARDQDLNHHGNDESDENADGDLHIGPHDDADTEATRSKAMLRSRKIIQSIS